VGDPSIGKRVELFEKHVELVTVMIFYIESHKEEAASVGVRDWGGDFLPCREGRGRL